ncbi:MAG: hypothetical protein JRM80_09725 [Nitrososphaerota archaeon]|nr:hypothetical protein [Nitrososphaerota archaeon]
MPLSKFALRVGRYSLWAGVGFAALTVVLLIFSASTQYIIYEVDSVITFVAAVVLLFRDPHARVQAEVLDAVLLSTNETIIGLSENGGERYAYLPKGNDVGGVVAAPDRDARPIGGRAPPAETVPPGRALAVAFGRISGATHPNLESLEANLSYVLRENFGIAESVAIERRGDDVDVTLKGSTVPCGCNVARPAEPTGTIGCTIASFLAILVSASTKRPLLLGKCVRDDAEGTWRVPMTLKPSTEGKVV